MVYHTIQFNTVFQQEFLYIFFVLKIMGEMFIWERLLV